MTAAELRERAIKILDQPWTRPTEEEVARAAVWADLAISAAISETGRTPAAEGGEGR